MSPKILSVIALTAGGLMLLAPPPPRPHPFPTDASYLRALADVHEFCAGDFELMCQPEQVEAMAPPPPRRLTTVLMDVSVVEEAAGEHGPGPDKAHMGIGGPKEEFCLRFNYEALTKPCAASIALLDEAAAELPPKHKGPCPFMVGLGLLGLVLVACVVRKVRAKKRVVKAIFDAIRSDDHLRALVEAKADTKVPEACKCCGAKCLKVALCAVLLAVLLSFVVGPATVFVSALAAAVLSKIVRASVACCCAPKVNATNEEDAPPDYEAVVEEADSVAVDPAAAKVAADAAAAVKQIAADEPAKELEAPLLK